MGRFLKTIHSAAAGLTPTFRGSRIDVLTLAPR